MSDQVGTVRKQHNAVGVRILGGWTVVWTLFSDETARRGYFYSDGHRSADYIAEGELVAGPSASETDFVAVHEAKRTLTPSEFDEWLPRHAIRLLDEQQP